MTFRKQADFAQRDSSEFALCAPIKKKAILSENDELTRFADQRLDIAWATIELHDIQTPVAVISMTNPYVTTHSPERQLTVVHRPWMICLMVTFASMAFGIACLEYRFTLGGSLFYTVIWNLRMRRSNRKALKDGSDSPVTV